jgi:hypothetical protein
VKVRPALPRDQDVFKSFSCSQGAHAHLEVERFFRHQALRWSLKEPDNVLLVLVETEDPEVDVLVGAIAYERSDDPEEWFIKALAIGKRWQGRGLRYGRGLLMTCLNDLAELYPGWTVYWNVDPGNTVSLHMSEAVGAEPDTVAGSDLIVFSVPLPSLEGVEEDILASLPPVEPTIDSAIDGILVIVRHFLARARRLAAATGAIWPVDYEQASVDFFERNVGVSLNGRTRATDPGTPR